MNFKEKCSHIKELITVEPLIVCYIIATMLRVPLLNELRIAKACKSNCGYNDTVCDSYKHDYFKYHSEFENVNKVIESTNYWQIPLQIILIVTIVLFSGSFSDKHKLRKLFMLLPIIGELFAVIGGIFSIIFMREWPLEVLIITEAIVPSLLGGQPMIMMAIYSYIADISTIKMRTLRIGSIQIITNFFILVVRSFNNSLFKVIGFIPILIITGLIYLIGLLYGIYRVKDVRSDDKIVQKSLLKDVINFKLIIDAIMILFKKKNGNKRIFMWLILLLTFPSLSVRRSESMLVFLYSGFVLYWSPSKQNNYDLMNGFIHLGGTATALPLFVKYLKLNDFMISFISFIDKVFCNLIIVIFARYGLVLYLGIVIGILSELSDVPIRSVSTKVVNNNDIGKMQSLIVIVEKLTPIISWNVFFKLYVKTHQSYPPAFFVAGLLIILIASLIVMYVCSCSLYENPFGNIGFNFLCRIMYVIERRDKRKILTQEIMLN